MGELVIVAYRAKEGKGEELMRLTRQHVPFLRALGLATDREPIIAIGTEGTVIEVFEWVDGGIARAHQMDEVQEMWAKYALICDYVPLAQLPEAGCLLPNSSRSRYQPLRPVAAKQLPAPDHNRT
jgi:hypothetical protein